MTAPSTKPPFLALPLELRIIIYRDLLTTHKVPTIHHTKRGCDRNLHLNPAILYVNRQIYTEASWILYEENEFRIVLYSEFDEDYDDELAVYYSMTRPRMHHVKDPPTFAYPRNLVLLGGSYFGADLNEYGTYKLPFVHVHGVIYPHCLSRMRHILIVTSTRDIIADDDYFACAGLFMIEILRCLVDGCVREKKKSVNMVIYGFENIKKKHPKLEDMECVEMLFREGLESEVSENRRSPEHVVEFCELFRAMKETMVCSVVDYC